MIDGPVIPLNELHLQIQLNMIRTNETWGIENYFIFSFETFGLDAQKRRSFQSKLSIKSIFPDVRFTSSYYSFNLPVCVFTEWYVRQ